MDKPLITVPEFCKPTSEIMYGYSGGMALYVADWDSVLFLFELTNTKLFAYYTIEIEKQLN